MTSYFCIYFLSTPTKWRLCVYILKHLKETLPHLLFSVSSLSLSLTLSQSFCVSNATRSWPFLFCFFKSNLLLNSEILFFFFVCFSIHLSWSICLIHSPISFSGATSSFCGGFGRGCHRKNLTHKLKHQELQEGKVVGVFGFLWVSHPTILPVRNTLFN